jgi:hypothetical protein
MSIQTITVAITTSSGGAFTTDTIPVSGKVVQYRYVPDGSNPLDTGADLDIVGAVTGVVVANQDDIGTSAFTKAPRQATHDATGAASLMDTTDSEPVEDYIFINEPLTVTIANGGDTLSGTLYIWICG